MSWQQWHETGLGKEDQGSEMTIKPCDDKPHIRVMRSVFYGVAGAPYWACSSPGAFGAGATPQSAYRDWRVEMSCRRSVPVSDYYDDREPR